jgi:hypothetical protein
VDFFQRWFPFWLREDFIPILWILLEQGTLPQKRKMKSFSVSHVVLSILSGWVDVPPAKNGTPSNHFGKPE